MPDFDDLIGANQQYAAGFTQQGLDGVARRGIAIVTHRLSALDAANTVIVLGKTTHESPAEIIASGRHTDLMASSDTYRWAVEQERA